MNENEKIKIVFETNGAKCEFNLTLGTKIKDVRNIELNTVRIAPDLLQYPTTNEGNFLFRLLRGCVVFYSLTKNEKSQESEFSSFFWTNKDAMIKWLQDGDFDITDTIANQIVKQYDSYSIHRSKIIETDGLYFFRRQPDKSKTKIDKPGK